MAPDVAVIVVDPCATLVALPEELMVAADELEDDHTTELVKSALLLSV
jgi:hypothetical protein